jgi:hypothetical protein
LRLHRSSLTPIVSRIGLLVLGLLSLIFLVTTSALAQETARSVAQPRTERRALDPLTGDEQALAERIARSDSKVKELLGEAGVRLVSATPVLIKAESPEKTNLALRQIEVVLFRPQGEVGARVIVNLQQNGVAAVARLSSDQVPMTNDDVADAFQLALRDAEVTKALGPAAQTFRGRPGPHGPPGLATPENTVGGLPVRSNDPNDPCSKHRCLRLTFRRGQDYLSEPIVTVDLTARHVYVERPDTAGKAEH